MPRIMLTQQITLALHGHFQTIPVEANFQKTPRVWQAHFKCSISSTYFPCSFTFCGVSCKATPAFGVLTGPHLGIKAIFLHRGRGEGEKDSYIPSLQLSRCLGQTLGGIQSWKLRVTPSNTAGTRPAYLLARCLYWKWRLVSFVIDSR